MKKVSYIVIAFILILVGCSNQSTSKELVDYDKEKIINSLNELSFNPEIPKLLPFEPIESEVDVADIGGMESSLLSVKFTNESKEEISFSAGKVENTFDFTEEKVKIKNGLEGKYGDENNTKILSWKKDDIYYELFADSDSYSKDEILKIAKSFYEVS